MYTFMPNRLMFKLFTDGYCFNSSQLLFVKLLHVFMYLFHFNLFLEGILHPWQTRGLKRIATVKMRKGRLFMLVAQREGIMCGQSY